MDQAVWRRAEVAGGGLPQLACWPDGDEHQSSLTVDGVHPNGAAYAVMAPLVEQAILAHQRK